MSEIISKAQQRRLAIEVREMVMDELRELMQADAEKIAKAWLAEHRKEFNAVVLSKIQSEYEKEFKRLRVDASIRVF
jgi:ABC-type proline/glycine betaine transport system substrate-binding protein